MTDTFVSTVAAQFTPTKHFRKSSNCRSTKPPTPSAEMKIFEYEQPSQIQSLPEPSLMACNGWLSPRGELLPCKWRAHSNLSKIIGYANEYDLEEKGWIKLTQMKWLTKNRYSANKLTDDQYNTILNWHKSNNIEIDYYDANK
jgi:hypothetical protein